MMINSRRTREAEEKGCCAKCKHLRPTSNRNSQATQCGIDGAIYADPGLLTMFICNKYKEVKQDGRL